MGSPRKSFIEVEFAGSVYMEFENFLHKIIFHVLLIAVPLRVQTFRCSPGPGV